MIIDFLSFPQIQHGINGDESMVVRVTGCPNGCARPYMAELGFVGDGPNSYQVFGSTFLALLLRQYLGSIKTYILLGLILNNISLIDNRSGLGGHQTKLFLRDAS